MKRVDREPVVSAEHEMNGDDADEIRDDWHERY